MEHKDFQTALVQYLIALHKVVDCNAIHSTSIIPYCHGLSQFPDLDVEFLNRFNIKYERATGWFYFT